MYHLFYIVTFFASQIHGLAMFVGVVAVFVTSCIATMFQQGF